jgi:hypothetical protein
MSNEEKLLKELRGLAFAVESILMLRSHALGPDGVRSVAAYLTSAKNLIAEVTGEPVDD